MDTVDLLTAYIRAGMRVLPLHAAPGGECTCGRACPSPGKHPRLRHGVADASSDVGQLAEWLARWPAANWGAEPPPGVVVLDIDVRSGGFDTLHELEAAHGPLPATMTASTGSGGEHRWFTHRGPARGRLGRGIDVKKLGGYLVMPPSRHASGGSYEWVNTMPASRAPRWVRTRLNPPITRTSVMVRGTGGIDGLVAFVLASPPGQRNSRLYWSMCRAIERHHDVGVLIDAAETIGLPRVEAEGTARSAAHAPARAAR